MMLSPTNDIFYIMLSPTVTCSMSVWVTFLHDVTNMTCSVSVWVTFSTGTLSPMVTCSMSVEMTFLHNVWNAVWVFGWRFLEMLSPTMTCSVSVCVRFLQRCHLQCHAVSVYVWHFLLQCECENLGDVFYRNAVAYMACAMSCKGEEMPFFWGVTSLL